MYLSIMIYIIVKILISLFIPISLPMLTEVLNHIYYNNKTTDIETKIISLNDNQLV